MAYAFGTNSKSRTAILTMKMTADETKKDGVDKSYTSPSTGVPNKIAWKIEIMAMAMYLLSWSSDDIFLARYAAIMAAIKAITFTTTNERAYGRKPE